MTSSVLVEASWSHPSASSSRGSPKSAPRSRLCGMAQHAASAVVVSAAAAAAAAIAATVLCTLAVAAAPTAVAAIAWCWKHRDHKGQASIVYQIPELRSQLRKGALLMIPEESILIAD
eukprot:symbB.v1.2.022748.t1/scaffold1999.1/size159930/5